MATPLGRRPGLSELLEAAGRRCNWVTAAIGFLLASDGHGRYPSDNHGHSSAAHELAILARPA
jgi:hypothetical protein